MAALLAQGQRSAGPSELVPGPRPGGGGPAGPGSKAPSVTRASRIVFPPATRDQGGGLIAAGGGPPRPESAVHHVRGPGVTPATPRCSGGGPAEPGSWLPAWTRASRGSLSPAIPLRGLGLTAPGDGSPRPDSPVWQVGGPGAPPAPPRPGGGGPAGPGSGAPARKQASCVFLSSLIPARGRALSTTGGGSPGPDSLVRQVSGPDATSLASWGGGDGPAGPCPVAPTATRVPGDGLSLATAGGRGPAVLALPPTCNDRSGPSVPVGRPVLPPAAPRGRGWWAGRTLTCGADSHSVSRRRPLSRDRRRTRPRRPAAPALHPT